MTTLSLKSNEVAHENTKHHDIICSVILKLCHSTVLYFIPSQTSFSIKNFDYFQHSQVSSNKYFDNNNFCSLTVLILTLLTVC